jgi:hypothetical protein
MRIALTLLALAASILWAGHSTRLRSATAADAGPDSAAATDAGDHWQPPMTDDGWLDLTALLVPSDGSRLPGGQPRNDTRDRGSKLVFFDPAKGDNATGEVYDPMGLKTFMAVATNMRRGGTDKIPASGKPSWTGDYPWDARFTGQAVVNWVREGFSLCPVGSPNKSS